MATRRRTVSHGKHGHGLARQSFRRHSCFSELPAKDVVVFFFSLHEPLRQFSLGLPEEQDLLSHAKVKACFESQDHKRVLRNPSVDGHRIRSSTSPAVHRCGGRYLQALDVNPQLCSPQTNWPFSGPTKISKRVYLSSKAG